MRKVVSIVSLFVALAVLFPTPSRAGSVSITFNPGSLTVVEGNTITLVWTITNNTGSTILGPNGGNLSFFQNSFPPSGDVFDQLTITAVANTCSVTSLSAGASCTFSKTFSTTFITGDKENSDFGFQQENLGLDYVCPNCIGDTDPFTGNQGQFAPVSSTVSVTVADIGATPEPSSLLLLGTGLLGLGPFIRRFMISRDRDAF